VKPRKLPVPETLILSTYHGTWYQFPLCSFLPQHT